MIFQVYIALYRTSTMSLGALQINYDTGYLIQACQHTLYAHSRLPWEYPTQMPSYRCSQRWANYSDYSDFCLLPGIHSTLGLRVEKGRINVWPEDVSAGLGFDNGFSSILNGSIKTISMVLGCVNEPTVRGNIPADKNEKQKQEDRNETNIISWFHK